MSIFEKYTKILGNIKKDEFDHEIDIDPIKEIETASFEKKIHISTLFYLIIIFCVCFIFIFKLFDLQVVEGSAHELLAEGNRIRIEEFRAPRGIIYDKNKNPLVKNIPLYNLELYPIDLSRDKKERIEVYEKISNILNLDLKDIISQIEDNKLFSSEPIIIKPYIEREEAMMLELKLKDFPFIKVSVMPAREYENISGLSHILGYIGKITQEQYDQKKDKYSISDFIGQNGLELAYEEYLKGTKGQKKVEVDSLGRIQRELDVTSSQAGYDLISSIDLDLQKKSAEELSKMIESIKNDEKKDTAYRDVRHGVAIVSNPKTGEIISMVSLPSYDNNLFSKGISQENYEKIVLDEEKPMLNRAISGIFPSGSIIKPIIAAAALDSGVITEYTSIVDPPNGIQIGEWTFPDWKNHGTVDVRKAIAESCNVFFYAVGGGWEHIKGMGVLTMKKYLEKFGFGQKTGIEIIGEEKGLIPDPDWKEEFKNEPWYLGDNYHLAIGQGDFLITPLQIVNAINAIANNGKLYKPHFISKIVDKDGSTIKDFEPEIIIDKLVESEYNLQVVREGMKQAVYSNSGSARQLQDLPVNSAGKTGTAQFDASDLKKTHSWFVGFAPFDDPELSIVVLIENGGDGFDAAEPVAKEIMKYYFEHKKN